ncbi:MAG: hypothetical protein J2O48_00290 [Solirubrobacterales bacterium]|nr:hypothetical protein [Solirubrobacterales bacterium]
MATDVNSAARKLDPRLRYGALGLGALVVVALVLLLSGAFKGGSGGSSAGAQVKYGHPPASVTVAEPPTPTVVTATAAKPDLKAVPGFSVKNQLAGGSAELMAEGPQVPAWFQTQADNDQLQPGEQAPSTFYVNFSSVHGQVPLGANQFSVITYQGKILHPKVTAASGGALPKTVPAGGIKLKLVTQLPEGDGSIRWAPDGNKIQTSWIWSLEVN